VRATTVRKELSALRGFVVWAQEQRLIGACEVPTVPKRATGKPHTQRRRVAAPAMGPDEIEVLLAALPEWSTSPRVPPFPIRARFRVQYETGLRPALVSQLHVPTHYRKGAAHISITADLDKGRWVRRVPLSDAAREALDAVVPTRGTIFGHHDYREHLTKAAAVAFGEGSERAELFAGAHLRSARATHWLDAGAPITGVQYQLGQRRLETTARYARASERAALEVVRGAQAPRTKVK
jgi:integrase